MRWIAVVFLAACSQSLGALGTVMLAGAGTPASGPRVHGKSCASTVLGLPLGAPSLSDAAHAAQRANGGAPALEDVRVSKTFWTIGIYGSECVVVDARATTTRREH